MPTIDKLSQSTVLQGDDVLAVFQQTSDDTRKVSVDTFAARLNEIILGEPDETTYSLTTSGADFTVAISPAAPGGSVWAQLTLSGTATNGKITLPGIDTRANGQEVLVTITQAVTSLTFDGLGAGVIGAPTTLAANGFFRLRYDSVGNAWYRVGGGIVDGAAVKVSTVRASGAITAAGAVRGALVDTAIATVGAGTLSAAALVGGVITRSGPTAAYTDTTDTAASIVAAIPNAQVGTSFDLTIINTVAFASTIAAGAGVTLSGTTAIAASTWRRFIGTITNVSTPAVTLKGIGSGPL